MAKRARSTHGQPPREAQHWKSVIEKIMHETGWSQDKLAKQARVTPGTISKIMNESIANVQTRTATLLGRLESRIFEILRSPQDAATEQVWSSGNHTTRSKREGAARAIFEVAGSFDIPSEKRPGGVAIPRGARWQSEFWDNVGNGLIAKPIITDSHMV